MWWHGWNRDTDFDQLGGSLIAGHLIECSSYVCGGYYSGFKDLFGGCENIGFPIAEIYADGSCTIEKEPGTGGEVSPSQCLQHFTLPMALARPAPLLANTEAVLWCWRFVKCFSLPESG